MSQFPVTISGITLRLSKMRAVHAVKDQIDAIYHQTGVRPLVFTPSCCRRFALSSCKVKAFAEDIVQALVALLQQEMKLDQRRLLIVPMALTLIISINMMRALRRLITPLPTMTVFRCNLDRAQVILLGVSRCGKTPHQSVSGNAIWYPRGKLPFIADDMDNLVLPASLKPLQHKLFG